MKTWRRLLDSTRRPRLGRSPGFVRERPPSSALRSKQNWATADVRQWPQKSAWVRVKFGVRIGELSAFTTIHGPPFLDSIRPGVIAGLDTNPGAGVVRLSPPPALLVQMDRPRPVEEQDHASSRSTNPGRLSPVPFEEIYEQHSPDVYRYCLARLADPAAAEDATANTFMKAFSAYSRVGSASDGVRLWLFRIATNVFKDHHRSQSRRRRLFAALVGSVRPEQDPEAQAMLSVELQGMLDALAGLASRERHLVGLRAGAGLPFSEIAALMNMNENSAWVATHRALQRLRMAVEANR